MSGFVLDAVARSGATYGQGTGPIIMNNVACNSQDTELLKCNFDGNTKDCQHNRDAGVICQPRGTYLCTSWWSYTCTVYMWYVIMCVCLCLCTKYNFYEKII